MGWRWTRWRWKGESSTPTWWKPAREARLAAWNISNLEETPIVTKTAFQMYAENLYEKAGDFVEEEQSQIYLTKYGFLLNNEGASILQQVLEENLLSFEL